MLTIILGLIIPVHARGQGPLYGEDIHLVIDAHVRNVEGISQEQITSAEFQANVSLTAWIYYTHYNETGFPVTEYKYSTLEPVGVGAYSVTLNLGDAVSYIHWVDVEINNRDQWLLKYKGDQKLTDTHYQFDLYVIPMNDNDKNGIRDDFEWELVRNFCPTLIFHLPSTFCYPEPVQIMAGPNNSNIWATFSGPWDNKEGKPKGADSVQYWRNGSNWKQLIPGYGQTTAGTRFDYSYRIYENPIALTSGDSIQYIDGRTRKFVKLYVSGNQFIWIHFDWPGDYWRDWESHYKPYRENNNYRSSRGIRPTIYATIWSDGIEIGIQYWFFYPFDHFANNHEGDWEHINVLLYSQFPERAKIKSVVYYFHFKWHEWEPKDLQFSDSNKDHPIVYVGGTPELEGLLGNMQEHEITVTYSEGHLSGASYPDRATWKNIEMGPWSLFTVSVHEKVYGRGPMLQWDQLSDEADQPFDGDGLELLKDPNFLGSSYFIEHPEWSWLKANIGFGTPKNDPNPLVGDVGLINGPYLHKGWRKLRDIPNSGFKQY